MMIYNFNDFKINEKTNFNEPVLILSRLIVNDLKFFIDDVDTDEVNEKYFTKIYDDVSIRVEFTKSKINGYDIEAYTDFDEDNSITYIELNIDINPLYFPLIMNDFISELKDALRHEFEHTTQVDNLNKHIEKSEYKSQYEDFIGYVLSKSELPAFLQGFYKQAKTRRTTMTEIIDEYFLSRIKWFDNYEKDYPDLRKKLIDAGKKLLPKSKW